MGYHRAGFKVIGVDIQPQPHYPFEFVQADAIDFLSTLDEDDMWGAWGFEAIHASPPCQEFSVTRSVHPHLHYPDLIEPIRVALVKSGLPWVMENVPGAPLYRSLVLCGCMFEGLRVYRRRLFESNVMLLGMSCRKHRVPVARGKQRRARYDEGYFVTVAGDPGRRVGNAAMGIDWMTGNEVSQAIPPAYTEYIGRQLLQALGQPPSEAAEDWRRSDNPC